VASRVLGVIIDRAELLVGTADPRPGHLHLGASRVEAQRITLVTQTHTSFWPLMITTMFSTSDSDSLRCCMRTLGVGRWWSR
jgi:hypothetical protein